MRYQFTCPVCEQTVTRTYVAVCCSYACRGILRKRAVRVYPFTTSEDGMTALIPLYNRGEIVGHTLVDVEDAEWASQWQWHPDADGYASRHEKSEGKPVGFLLHRELLGLIHHDGLEGDHRNRIRTDNRRMNLRIVPKHGNRQNMPSHRRATSQFRGVHWDALHQKWRARIKANGKSIHLGLFDREEEAGAVAKAARLRYQPYAVD